MVDASSLYNGALITLGTMHGKERAIARPFSRVLGADIMVPAGLDTDAYGTFTGEIARYGNMLDAARAKARLGMQKSGLPLGVSSEGSYGPHPYLPFVPGGTELMVFIDDARGIEVRESIVVSHTNYDNLVCTPGDNISAFLRRAGFPQHAIVVQPHVPIETRGLFEKALAELSPRLAHGLKPLEPVLFKAVREIEEVARAVEASGQLSLDGKARLSTDMRAHLNPTRMTMIRVAAKKLAKRIACLCPGCKAPGFGIVDVARGLPCADCGMPTKLAVAEIHRCAMCGIESRKPLRRDDERASPGQCQYCNP